MNLRELLTGTFTRLRYVYRWSTFRNAHPESVAEHCYYVALYSLFICEWLQTKNPIVSRQSVFYDTVAKALCHDLEEVRTGDMPRTFKHSDPRLEKALALTAGIAMRQTISSLDLNTDTHRQFIEWWERCKSPDMSGSIVAFADYLSVLSYLLQEKLDNNHSVTFHLETMTEYYKEFSGARYDFIRELVDDTRVFVEELVDEKS